ncbi:hypothetical protein F5146DRAFT_1135586 [Armillaria mellea]|nr:hypothetical protein F5146DRAFT_1135586 [Armillaria mellea]
MFQTAAIISNPFSDNDSNKKHPISHSHMSNVYYPFDRYTAMVFAFAEDTTTNVPVKLHLDSTSGLVVGLKITAADVFDSSVFTTDNITELVYVQINLQRGTLVIWYCIVITITFWLITLTICLLMITTVGFRFQQRNKIVVVPVGTVFAFISLRSTMPGAPDGFGDVLDFVGVLPCLVLLSISAITMVGIYIFTDPVNDSHEKLTWSALVEALSHLRKANSERIESKDLTQDSYSMDPLWKRSPQQITTTRNIYNLHQSTLCSLPPKSPLLKLAAVLRAPAARALAPPARVHAAPARTKAVSS